MRGGVGGLVLMMLLTMLAAGAGQAQGPEGLRTGVEAAGWEGVGRLDIDGKGFCTGALIAPDLVLTAAHCLFDRADGARVDPSRIAFLAGLRNGRAVAVRTVRRALPHPAYRFDPEAGVAESRHDLALLELDRPVRPTEIAPFALGTEVAAGAQVSVVSYAMGREEVPAIERSCAVLGQEAGVMVTTCEVDFGASGAPIFHMEGEEPRIVSVVSAKGELGEQRVALGTALTAPLAELMAAMAAGQRMIALPQVRSIAAGERAETGARFIRLP